MAMRTLPRNSSTSRDFFSSSIKNVYNFYIAKNWTFVVSFVNIIKKTFGEFHMYSKTCNYDLSLIVSSVRDTIGISY